tara:strand:+ start:63 stop:518 length:456 start_codon:yes stop_codon:yes gene_type:complete
MKINKAHLKEELQELKAEKLLSQLEENQDIPVAYFENLSSDFLVKIKQEEVAGLTRKGRIRKLFLSVSIAAALLIFLAIPLLPKNTQTIDWAQVSSSDLVDYLEQNIDEFSDEEIASVSVLSDNSIFRNTAYSDEVLEEYLSGMNLEETLF